MRCDMVYLEFFLGFLFFGFSTLLVYIAFICLLLTFSLPIGSVFMMKGLFAACCVCLLLLQVLYILQFYHSFFPFLFRSVIYILHLRSS
ncbi:hypothetical protein QBC43DRAFT_86162 [Cladorrhinum sp. PSN259]|nr:hypothetical protein QBC43DRAFT_86162 [Cladorrhinum sp. PSN259]